MAWITQTELDNAIGSDQVTALGLTTGSARLTQYEIQARATVIAAMQYAGYAAPADTVDAATVTGAFLQKLTIALMLRDAFALIPGISLTDAAQAAISQGLTMLDALYEKKLPIPGLQPGTLDGLGGVKFGSDPQYTAPTTRPVFRALRGSGF